MQNITFSAQEELITQARNLARARGTTLNVEFRAWLSDFVSQQGQDIKQTRLRSLLDDITTPAAGQRMVPLDVQFTPPHLRVPAREAFNEREQRMLDRLNK